VVVRRSDVYWVSLDPTVGSEIQKTRPCVVVSPDELNSHLRHIIVAPLTTAIRSFRYRVAASVAGRPVSVILNQLRTVDRARLGKRIGKIDTRTMRDILGKLQAMFAE
jgi:mRNA interferase MazF